MFGIRTSHSGQSSIGHTNESRFVLLHGKNQSTAGVHGTHQFTFGESHLLVANERETGQRIDAIFEMRDTVVGEKLGIRRGFCRADWGNFDRRFW